MIPLPRLHFTRVVIPQGRTRLEYSVGRMAKSLHARSGARLSGGGWLGQVREEARRLARAALRGTPPGFSLQTDDVVHNALIRLMRGGVPEPPDPEHAIALIGQAVRCAVVDHVRRRTALRRRASRTSEDAEPIAHGPAVEGAEILDLHELLDKLAADPKTEPAARAFVLRFFLGLTVAEVAQVFRISLATAERRIRFVRGWLRQHLHQ